MSRVCRMRSDRADGDRLRASRARAAAPAARDLVALAADPETGNVGRLTVSTPAGKVELDRSATRAPP